jgi:hypothetical protein
MQLRDEFTPPSPGRAFDRSSDADRRRVTGTPTDAASLAFSDALMEIRPLSGSLSALERAVWWFALLHDPDAVMAIVTTVAEPAFHGGQPTPVETRWHDLAARITDWKEPVERSQLEADAAGSWLRNVDLSFTQRQVLALSLAGYSTIETTEMCRQSVDETQCELRTGFAILHAAWSGNADDYQAPPWLALSITRCRYS